MTVRPTIRAALGCALGVAVLSASVPAKAGDDDQNVSFDRKILRNLLEGLGLQRDGGSVINYQERPPLVIPSNSNLPPPETTDTAAQNPAWPKDPDIARRKQEAALERNRNISEEREREQNPLRPNQITPGARPGTTVRGTRQDDGYRSSGVDASSPMTPSQLGYKGGLFSKMFGGSDDQETAKFTSEPPRASLTDPPAGYQTPSPDQPYGTGPAAAPKATDDYMTRGELKR